LALPLSAQVHGSDHPQVLAVGALTPVLFLCQSQLLLLLAVLLLLGRGSQAAHL
jgi:hypothetical protein